MFTQTEPSTTGLRSRSVLTGTNYVLVFLGHGVRTQQHEKVTKDALPSLIALSEISFHNLERGSAHQVRSKGACLHSACTARI